MRHFLILVLFLIPFAACDGGGGNGELDTTRMMNDIERHVWNLTRICFQRSDIEPFASAEYAEPRVEVVPDPCNSSGLMCCPILEDNVIEFNEALYFSDENATPLNTDLMTHCNKHILSFQASGIADFGHDGIWFDGEPPCTDVGFGNSNLCAFSGLDCEDPLAPFDEP